MVELSLALTAGTSTRLKNKQSCIVRTTVTTEEMMLRVFLTYLAIFGVFNLGGYIYLRLFVAKKQKTPVTRRTKA